MKHIYNFSSILALLILLLVMTSIYKQSDKESYTVDKSGIDSNLNKKLSVDTGSTRTTSQNKDQLDFDFKIEKTGDNSEILKELNNGFSVKLNTDNDPETEDLPRQGSPRTLFRVIGDEYYILLLDKAPENHKDYPSSVSDKKLYDEFEINSSDFFNESRLKEKPFTRLFSITPDDISSASYIIKPVRIDSHGTAYIGFASTYSALDGNFAIVEIGTARRGVQITYAVILTLKEKTLSKADATKILNKLAGSINF